jgi:hypothetical protein
MLEATGQTPITGPLVGGVYGRLPVRLGVVASGNMRDLGARSGEVRRGLRIGPASCTSRRWLVA